MYEKLLMTPGPTYISEEVRRAMAKPITNPDLDSEFFEFYKNTCNKLQQLLKTKNDVLILSGEGILGLESACASLIEPGDRVLCIDNGIFGKGFGDFSKMYGAEVTYYKDDYKREINVERLEEFLKEKNDFKIATIVHCETPSGITNPIDRICPLLNKYGIITVVDAVSSIGGEEIEVDKWKVDIMLGGSQKCLSATPGLTFLSVSDNAWGKILNRTNKISGFYCNLSIWKNWYEKKWFPYTQPISEIYGLNVAVKRLLKDKNRIQRHAKIGDAARKSIEKSGLSLFPKSGYSNTVSTIMVPDNITYKQIFNSMLQDYNVMIAGAFDFLGNKVFRIGHMGENCYEEKVYVTLKALNNVLSKKGFSLKDKLHQVFIDSI